MILSILIIVLVLNFNLFNIISISSGISVLALIGIIIYHIEHKKYLKDLSMSTTEYISGRVEITESMKGLGQGLFAVIISIILTFIILFIVLLIGGRIIESLLLLSIFLIIGGYMLYKVYKKFVKGTSELRKFIVSERYIEIIVPPKPTIHVSWSDIERIELISAPYMKFSHEFLEKTIHINMIDFIGKNYHETFEIGRYFVKKLNEIIDNLINYASSMNKEFIDLREK